MPTFRAYFRNARGQFGVPELFVADTDQEAVGMASRRLDTGGSLELWDGDRLVARIDKGAAPAADA